MLPLDHMMWVCHAPCSGWISATWAETVVGVLCRCEWVQSLRGSGLWQWAGSACVGGKRSRSAPSSLSEFRILHTRTAAIKTVWINKNRCDIHELCITVSVVSTSG